MLGRDIKLDSLEFALSLSSKQCQVLEATLAAPHSCIGERNDQWRKVLGGTCTLIYCNISIFHSSSQGNIVLFTRKTPHTVRSNQWLTIFLVSDLLQESKISLPTENKKVAGSAKYK